MTGQCPTPGKKSFRTRAAALRRIAAGGSLFLPVRVYWCRRCGAYHLSSHYSGRRP